MLNVRLGIDGEEGTVNTFLIVLHVCAFHFYCPLAINSNNNSCKFTCVTVKGGPSGGKYLFVALRKAHAGSVDDVTEAKAGVSITRGVPKSSSRSSENQIRTDSLITAAQKMTAYPWSFRLEP